MYLYKDGGIMVKLHINIDYMSNSKVIFNKIIFYYINAYIMDYNTFNEEEGGGTSFYNKLVFFFIL